ncbi:hypothetical protein P154DRAFT_346370 [Amniculicola lignicola CBS 123094]|uniref:Uncharacterized protein n=1 Tax=Amniculicola lignicola CBS 123094 TaxID=1392246 RepID=A0A6A5W318_9PLEO|nr:hypothetical protein P154DRAFT_346370 [Amniculicola lignicola CBS 123094]
MVAIVRRLLSDQGVDREPGRVDARILHVGRRAMRSNSARGRVRSRRDRKVVISGSSGGFRCTRSADRRGRSLETAAGEAVRFAMGRVRLRAKRSVTRRRRRRRRRRRAAEQKTNAAKAKQWASGREHRSR